MKKEMKKVLLVLSVFLLAIGGTYLDAQEVTIGAGTLLFSGKLVSGIFWEADNAEKESQGGAAINAGWIGSDGKTFLWNESDSKAPLRVDFSAAYTVDNIGFRLRLRANDARDGTGLFAARYAYGWVDFLGGAIKTTAGFIDLSDNVWGTLGDGDWDIAGNGLRVEVSPFKFFNWDEKKTGSLNIGAFFMVPSEANPNRGRDDQGREILRTITLERTLRETALGFRYTHPWFYVGAQLKLDSDIDGVDIFEGVGQAITPSHKVWSDAGDEMRFMFGVGFTWLPEVVFSVEGNFEGLGNWEARGMADLRQTVSYTFFNRLTAGVKAQEILWGYDIRTHVDYPFDLTPWMQFKPFVNYKVTPEFTAGMEAGFGFGHLVTGSLEPESSNNGDGNNKDRSFVNEKRNIYIKPNLAYNFTNGLALKLWYKATFISYANLGDDPIFEDLKLSDVPVDVDNRTRVDSLLKHQCALEFIWSF
jgi:hypothetical protein